MQSSGDYIKTVYAIFISMAIGQILFLVASIWEIEPSRDRTYDLHFQIIDGALILACIILAYTISSQHTKRAKIMRGIREKLVTYKKGLIIKWAILELATLFSIISFIMTGAQIFIFASIFSIIIFLLNIPGIHRTCNDLDMDNSERRVMETPDAAI